MPCYSSLYSHFYLHSQYYGKQIISSETNEIHRKVCQKTEASVSISQTAIMFNWFNTPLHCFIEMRDERLFIHPLPILDVLSSPVQSLEADWQLTTT